MRKSNGIFKLMSLISPLAIIEIEKYETIYILVIMKTDRNKLAL